MKRIHIILVAIAVMLSAAACHPEPSLTITPDSYDAPAAGETVEFAVKANYAWTAESNADWVRVTPNEDGTQLKVTISQNTQPDSREAQVSLTCETLVKTLRIRQAQKNMVVADNGTVSVTWEQQTVEIALQTNVAFTVSIEQEGDWISYVSTKGLTSKNLILSVKENNLQVAREARVTLTGEGENLKTLVVSQAARPQVFSVVHNRTSFPAPVLFGFSLRATIDWGDGSKGTYNSTVTHSYTREGQYVVALEATGAETASLSDLVGVLKVDLSGF